MPLVQFPAYIWVLTQADQTGNLLHFLLLLKLAADFQILLLYLTCLPVAVTSTHFSSVNFSYYFQPVKPLRAGYVHGAAGVMGQLLSGQRIDSNPTAS